MVARSESGTLAAVERWRALRNSLGLYALDAVAFGAFFLLYYVARGVPADRVGLATDNALWIIELEQDFGVFVEASWQRFAMDHSALMDVANFTYRYLHLYMIPVFGLIVFLRNRDRYRLLRNAIVISMLFAVPFYWFVPVTPPRLLEAAGQDFGFVDTIYRTGGSREGFFFNNYAALPSYHAGWNLLFVAVVCMCWRSWAVRITAASFSVLMFFSIVATANHYFFDMAVGVAVSFFAFWLAIRLERWFEANPGWRDRLTFRVRGYRLPY